MFWSYSISTEINYLTGSMNSGISSSGTIDLHMSISNPGQGFFNTLLNTVKIVLTLKSFII